MYQNLKNIIFISLLLSVIIACEEPETPDAVDERAGFLASNLDAMDVIDLDGFEIPTSYDLDGPIGPGSYSGQIRRIAQLQEIVDSSRNEPIFWDIAHAMEVGGLSDVFSSAAAQNTASSSSDIRSKIDELNFDNGDTSVADDFAELADRLVTSSQANFTITASNGVAGMINTGTTRRHVDANGLEFIQMLEKGMYGPLLYDQMVDDYLRPSQAGADNPAGNNESAVSNYASNGTDRQHRWDEAFGYFGADPLTYPNPANTSNGDGSFIANYTFDFSDETEAAYGINLAERVMQAFIIGRTALKVGEGFGPNDETTNEAVYEAARADVKLYVEAGIAAAAFHYLNESIDDVTDEDKLHHLSEALGFMYSLSHNSEGRISEADVYRALSALGWGEPTLQGVYNINLWEVTDEQMEQARQILNESFPGFEDVPF